LMRNRRLNGFGIGFGGLLPAAKLCRSICCSPSCLFLNTHIIGARNITTLESILALEIFAHQEQAQGANGYCQVRYILALKFAICLILSSNPFLYRRTRLMVRSLPDSIILCSFAHSVVFRLVFRMDTTTPLTFSASMSAFARYRQMRDMNASHYLSCLCSGIPQKHAVYAYV